MLTTPPNETATVATMVAFAPKTEPHVFNPTSAQSVDSISSEVGYSWNQKWARTSSTTWTTSMLERKAAESYPAKDKAVIFFEVPDLKSSIAAQGRIG